MERADNDLVSLKGMVDALPFSTLPSRGSSGPRFAPQRITTAANRL